MSSSVDSTAPSGRSPEQTAREEELIDQVVASFEGTTDPRLKHVMQSLVRHLHAFVREVRLTEDEWWAAIRFLTAAGEITDANRQEFILASDVLGASMQMVTVNNEAFADATEATVFGPFFVEDAPHVELGGDVAGGATGTPCWVAGTVTDTDGKPLSGARIEVWEADGDGHYDVQYGDGRVEGRAHLFSDDDGRFRFWGVVPTPYPIPDDGPVGKLLAASGRSPMRAAHLHFMVTAPGCRRLVTHIFPEGDQRLDRDSVFGVRDSLIKRFEHQPAEAPRPDGRDLGGSDWARARFDIVLAPENGSEKRP